jgi:SAM-dependent methyltransferase
MAHQNASPEEAFYRQSALHPGQTPRQMPPSFLTGGRYQICELSLTQAPPWANDLIVELGCGSGEHLLWLKERFQFANSLGIDLGFGDYAHQGSAVFKPGNLNLTWEIDDRSVDVLIAMMVIEHLFNPIHSFLEIQRVLAPDGRAFVNLPLITGCKNRLRLLIGEMPITSVPYQRWLDEGHWDSFHLHYFTIASIFDLAQHVGLRVSRLEGVGRGKWLKNLFPSFLCGEISFELQKAT